MIEKEIKIFIVSTFYNTSEEDFIRGVKSITNQKYKNFEWIVINDGSNNKVNYAKIIKSNKHSLFFNFKENIGINKRVDFGIKKVLEKEINSLILFFDLDDEIMKNSLNKINKIYQKIGFEILFFYKMDYIWNKTNKEEINYIDEGPFYKNKINIKEIIGNDLYKLNDKNNYFLFYKLASTAGLVSKIYSSKFLIEMNKKLELKNNFFYDEKLYKNFDFKLSYLSAFYSNNIVFINDKYYKYYVASESSTTKNDNNFQMSFIYSNFIKFIKENLKIWKKNENYKKVIWVFTLLLFSVEKNNIKIITLLKIKFYLFFLLRKIGRGDYFKKILSIKNISLIFILRIFFKRLKKII